MGTRHARRTLLFQERLYLWDTASHPNLQGVFVSPNALCSDDGERERRRKQRLAVAAVGGVGGRGVDVPVQHHNESIQRDLPIRGVLLSVEMRWIQI